MKFWKDPVTGRQIPKEYYTNLEWRRDLLEEAEIDQGFRDALITWCRESILFWINTFCFTYRKFYVNEDGVRVNCMTPDETHRAYITWAIQDRHILEIQDYINNGEDLLTDKCREMGATWDHLMVLDHQFLFHRDRDFLMISRKEKSVDTGGQDTKKGWFESDPGTLFGKLDYIHKWSPRWLLPHLSRNKLRIVNSDLSSRIDGESSNASAGSSDRRTAIFLDEMSKMKEGEDIKRSTRDVTACRLPCSTPNGAGTAFSKWRMSGQIDVFEMPFYEHPEKGYGRYIDYNEVKESWDIKSPWFDREAATRSPRELAIEILMDHVESGDMYFDPKSIQSHKFLYGRKPRSKWDIDFVPLTPNDLIPSLFKGLNTDFVSARKDPKGKLHIWVNLIDGRFDQTLTYTVGCDISKGQGASNSVISIKCNETGEKVGEWTDANTPSYEFARVVAAVCIWVGGAKPRNLPFLIWEANGDPGIDFGRLMVKDFAYPCYYVDESVGKVSDKKGKSYGLHSSREKKEALLGQYRRAIAHGGIINHSIPALKEAELYIFYDGGGIGPAVLTEESISARSTHGDRVIADALTCWVSKEAGKAKTERVNTPRNSVAGRMKAAKDKRNRIQRARRGRHQPYNFTGNPRAIERLTRV